MSTTSSVYALGNRGTCWHCGQPSHPQQSGGKPRDCPASRSKCEKCQQSGHYTCCCPKCSDCQSQVHRSRGYRGCPKNKRKTQNPPGNTAPSKNIANIIQMYDIHPRHNILSLSNHAPPPNFVYEGNNWMKRDNQPHSTIALNLTVYSKDHANFRHPIKDTSRLH